MSYKTRATKRQKRRHQKKHRATESAVARYLRTVRQPPKRGATEEEAQQ